MIDVHTAPGPAWDPPPHRPPSSIPAVIALVLLVASSAAVLVGLYRGLDAPYLPRPGLCAALDVSALERIGPGAKAVVHPGKAARSCEFTAGPGSGDVTVHYATSAFEGRVAHAFGAGPEERLELPGVGEHAWYEVHSGAGRCWIGSEAQDANLEVMVNLYLEPAMCASPAVPEAITASLRATFARLA